VGGASRLLNSDRIPSWARAAAGPLLIGGTVVVVLHGFVFQPRSSSQHPDILGFWLPTYCFLGKSLAAGHLPAWNPHVMGGLPFAADPQSGWMYAPAMLLFSALSCGVAMRMMIVLQPILGGLGLYAFLRSEGLSRPAATTGGLALALGLAASRLVLFLPFPSAFAWTAVLLWLCSATLKSHTWAGRIGWALLAAGAWGQLAAAYFSHGLLLGTAVVIVYLGAKVWSRARSGISSRTHTLAIAGLLAIAFIAVNLAFLLPRLAYVPESSYGRIVSGPAQLGPALSALWPLKLATSPGGYLGMAALVLALAAFWSRRHRALALGFGAFGALSYVLGVDGVAPVLARAVEGVPVLEFYAHFPGRFSLGLFLVLPILAAIGLDAWLEPRPSTERALMAGPGILLFLVLPAALGAGVRVLIPTFGALTGAAALIVCARRPRLAALIPGLLAVELVAGGLLGQSSGSLGAARAYADDVFGTSTTNWFVPLARPDVDVEAYLRPDPITQALKDSGSRFVSLDPEEASSRGYLLLQDPGSWGLMANQRAMPFGLQDAQGYNPVQLERYWTYVRATSGGPLAYNASFYRRPPSSATLDMLQVGSVVSTAGQGPEGWHSVARDGRWVVYRTREPSLRSTVLTDVRVVEGPEASLRAVTAPDFDPLGTIVVEAGSTLFSGGIPNRTGGVELRYRERTAQSEIMTVEVPEPAIVLVRIPYARNWRATVDGSPARIFPADHFLMGVPVQAGSHTIRLGYDDPWIGYGLLGSLLSVLALLFSALLAWRCRRGPPPGARGGDRGQRSQVWMMTLVNRNPYLSEPGFFDSPLSRARTVIGTSFTRARCRRASTRTSELY
jgi:membrane protein YfhO